MAGAFYGSKYKISNFHKTTPHSGDGSGAPLFRIRESVIAKILALSLPSESSLNVDEPALRDWTAACSSERMLLDATSENLERYMDLLSARQKLVASNIANVDTPGYKTQDVDFQFEFMTLAKGEQPQTITTPDLKEKPDGNNVNVDAQARLLAEDAIRFDLASTVLHQQLTQIKEAINGGQS